jgi:hypothetical protein
VLDAGAAGIERQPNDQFSSEASVYRLLKARDLIASPAFIVIKAADPFKDKTTAPNQLWQTDFTFNCSRHYRHQRGYIRHGRSQCQIWGVPTAELWWKAQHRGCGCRPPAGLGQTG